MKENNERSRASFGTWSYSGSVRQLRKGGEWAVGCNIKV
jgi:hypothetical protein